MFKKPTLVGFYVIIKKVINLLSQKSKVLIISILLVFMSILSFYADKGGIDELPYLILSCIYAFSITPSFVYFYKYEIKKYDITTLIIFLEIILIFIPILLAPYYMYKYYFNDDKDK